MKTYQFESVIDENGAIMLPEDIKGLTKHRVRLTLVDLDSLQHDPVTLLQEITQAYTDISDEFDLDIADIYGTLRKHGTLPGDFDILIAATAIVHKLAIVTNNEKHYLPIQEHFPLVIRNWMK